MKECRNPFARAAHFYKSLVTDPKGTALLMAQGFQAPPSILSPLRKTAATGLMAGGFALAATGVFSADPIHTAIGALPFGDGAGIFLEAGESMRVKDEAHAPGKDKGPT